MNSESTQENLKSAETEKGGEKQNTNQDSSRQRDYILKNIRDTWCLIKLYIIANEKILLVIFNGLAIIAAFLLWFSTQKQIRIAEDITHKQLRAYVGITGITYGESGMIFSRTFFVKNSGQTPAYNTSVVYKWELMKNDSIHQFPKFIKKDSVASRIFISAEGKQLFDIKEANIFPGYDDFEKGTASFFVHGIIEYEDIFNERHFTKFGFRCETGNINVEYCKDHNVADQVK